MAAAIASERTRFWRQLEAPATRVLMLGQAEARRGDARLALRDLGDLSRVTAADVSRVVGRYLTRAKPAVVVIAAGGTE